jgi:hypothetical protein
LVVDSVGGGGGGTGAPGPLRWVAIVAAAATTADLLNLYMRMVMPTRNMTACATNKRFLFVFLGFFFGPNGAVGGSIKPLASCVA